MTPKDPAAPGNSDKGEGEEPFDVRKHHHFGQSRFFDDFQVGETFYLPSRTMTDALFAAFQLASGDNDPIHYDVEYCRARGHRGLLAHGMQTLIQTAAGAGIFPHMVSESLLGLIEVTGRVLKPVYAGDTLYSLLTISHLRPQRTTGVLTMRATVHNQDSVLVMEGEHKYLIRRHPSFIPPDAA